MNDMAPRHIHDPPVSGRPLIFMSMVLTAWTGARIGFALAPADQIAVTHHIRSAAKAMPPAPPRAMARHLAFAPAMPSFARHSPHRRHPAAPAPLPPPLHPPPPPPPATHRAPPTITMPALLPPVALLPLALPAGRPPAPPSPPSGQRLHAAAWLYWRDQGGAAAAGGRLGGSQLGLRLDRRFARLPVGGISAYGRITSALERPHGAELALGTALQPRLPGAVPLSLGVERRIALDPAGRNAFAIVAATGLRCGCGPGGLILDGYAQGGMVGFRHRHGFADARLSALRPLAPSGLSAGASIAGGTQPGLARLDIGPVLEWRLPLRPLPGRLTIEWRERVAGTAAPGSGLAVTLAADF